MLDRLRSLFNRPATAEDDVEPDTSVARTRETGGAPGDGTTVLVVASALLGASLAALSNGMALLARKEETVIAASNFVLLPLTFLSSAFMQRDLVPGWIQTVARYNPVEWTVQAGREALTANPDWGLVLSRAGLLAALCLACTWLATRAFRAYQQTIGIMFCSRLLQHFSTSFFQMRHKLLPGQGFLYKLPQRNYVINNWQIGF